MPGGSPARGSHAAGGGARGFPAALQASGSRRRRRKRDTMPDGALWDIEREWPEARSPQTIVRDGTNGMEAESR